MKVTKDMTIAEILNIDQQGLAPIFFDSGMHCLGCAMASGESVEQACSVHGVDVEVLVSSLNKHLDTLQ